MALSKIEQIIDEFNEYLDDCKTAPFSKNNLSVPRDALQDFLDQLRLSTPDEIKRYQKIISNRDSIIKAAEANAATIIQEAEKRAAEMITETQVYQDALQHANELVEDARQTADRMLTQAENDANEMVGAAMADADSIRTGALRYANDIMETLENSIGEAYNGIAAKSEMLVGTLKAHLDIVVANRLELNGEAAPAQQLTEEDRAMLEDAQLADADEVEEEVLGFDENTFLNENNE